MTTRGSLEAKVADMLARTDLTTQIASELTSAIRHYESEQFWFNEHRLSLSCSSTVVEYTLSASIVQILTVQITRSSSSYVIDEISEAERISYDTGNVTGDPSWYAFFRGAFIPYPRPSSAYVATISCIRKPATLSVTTDSNVFTINARELIESRTAANIALRYTRSTEDAQVFKLLEQEALAELRARDSRKQPNRIIPTDF